MTFSTRKYRYSRKGGLCRWSVFASVLTVLALLAAAAMFRSAYAAEDEFLDPEDAFRYSVAMSAPDTLDIHFAIAPAYYMYRERFEIEAPPGLVTGVSYPPGLVKYDPTFEKNMEVYYGQVTLRLQLGAPGAPPDALAPGPHTLAVVSQGCADAGLCYPPDRRELQLVHDGNRWMVEGAGVTARVPEPLAVVLDKNGRPMGAAASARDDAAGLNPFDFGDTTLAAWLQNAGWVQVVGLCLLLGLLLAFTPCVLPMVPILMAVIAGDANRARTLSRARGLALAAAFVLGMSLVYTVLGIFAGLLGSGLMIWLQTPWVLAVFAVLLAVLALAMFDVFTLQAPAAVQTALHERLNRLPGGRYGGVFVMGMLSALIVGPCVAAPLAGVLLFISQTGDVWLGGSALFALAWGSGIPLLLLGASSGALLPRAGAWMEGVKWAFGLLLLATAWWMLASLLPDWLLMLGWAALATAAAVMMGAFEPLPSGAGPGRHALKAAGLMLAAWALFMLAGLAGGGRDPFQPLAPYQAAGAAAGVPSAAGSADVAAAVKRRFVQVDSINELEQVLSRADRPVMLDFYADWCVSCIEMERFTFSDPGVARTLDGFVLVQADVTANTPEHRALLKKFRLFGPPGIIFFDPQGRELDLRVVGFQNAERFGRSLQAVLERVQASAAVPTDAGTLKGSAAPAEVAPPSPAALSLVPGAAFPASGIPSASALLAQQLRGFDGEVGENAVGPRALEAQQ